MRGGRWLTGEQGGAGERAGVSREVIRSGGGEEEETEGGTLGMRWVEVGVDITRHPPTSQPTSQAGGQPQ